MHARIHACRYLHARPRRAALAQPSGPLAQVPCCMGGVQVADNAGIFAEGGLKPYLAYVRGESRYRSAYLESTLEWRDDVKDGLEVSTYLGPAVQSQSQSGAAPAAASAS